MRQQLIKGETPVHCVQSGSACFCVGAMGLHDGGFQANEAMCLANGRRQGISQDATLVQGTEGSGNEIAQRPLSQAFTRWIYRH